MDVKTKSDLQRALYEANEESVKKGGRHIPYSHKKIIELEKLGIIPISGKKEENRPGITRYYSSEQITEIVAAVVEYVNRNE